MLTLGLLFLVNYGRALYGDARDTDLAAAWGDAAIGRAQIAAAFERDTMPEPVPPVVDSIANGFVASVNAVAPHLIVRAMPRRSTDLYVILNPTVYDLYGGCELARMTVLLGDFWRYTLASAGALWPEGQRFEPGVAVLRLEDGSAGPHIRVVAESRDSADVYYGVGRDGGVRVVPSAISITPSRPGGSARSAEDREIAPRLAQVAEVCGTPTVGGASGHPVSPSAR